MKTRIALCTIKQQVRISTIMCLFLLLTGCRQNTVQYIRGVSIYPDNPAEDFSPTLVADNYNYRNITQLRSAFHSSSYDYNLTAQLVTDGTIQEGMPDYITVSINLGVVPKNKREWLLDHNSVTEMQTPEVKNL